MLKLLIVIMVSVGAIFAYIKYLEKNSIFFPDKEIEATPAALNLSFENIYLKTADNINIHGWFIPYAGAEYTLLLFHGNGGNISHRLEKILLLRQAKINIFIIDYRGYGKSKGNPTEKGIYLDAQAAYDYLLGELKTNPANIVLYGESLGAAVAIALASKEKVRALIIEGAFSSGRDMGKRMYPYIPEFILPDILDSLRKIKKINTPKLFIHSKDDEVVPFDLGKKLYAAAPDPKEFTEISGGHNDAFIDSKDKYISAIIDFVNSLNNN